MKHLVTSLMNISPGEDVHIREAHQGFPTLSRSDGSFVAQMRFGGVPQETQ